MANVGLPGTFQLLAETENKAAEDLLVAALDCTSLSTRQHAIRSTLERRSASGHREIFRRLPKLDDACREVVKERPERLDRAVNEALRHASPEQVSMACDAIVSFRLYDALPALVSTLFNAEGETVEVLAKAALKLTEAYYEELSSTEHGHVPKNQQDALRGRVTKSLEEAARKFFKHERVEMLEAFLMVAKSKNVTLYQVLQRKTESSHEPIVDILTKSTRGGIIRLLLKLLDDPRLPKKAVDVISSRGDQNFVEHLLHSVSSKPEKMIGRSLVWFESFVWAKADNPLFDELDDDAQQGAVQLIVLSSMNRREALEILGFLLLEGKPGGRRAAAKALKRFKGPEADGLTVRAINDGDPGVRASLVPQLRARNVPGALMMLIRMVDDPDEQVHEALRKAMPEFSFRQLMINFDNVPDSLQPAAAQLVRKIDTDVRGKLIHEMEGPSPVRRRRAVLAARAMGMASQVESMLIGLLSDQDHVVRVAAAKTLATCQSASTWDALRDAMLDRSVAVQEAAEESLESISLFLQEHLDDPDEGEDENEEQSQSEQEVAS